MSTFVIVHGAWGGGWEWAEVATYLRRAGHVVFTPTLTGLGDRAHLCRGQRVGMREHVQDVIAQLTLEALDGVVLCGASYGGMAATGAADALPDRVRLLVYLDALVPRDGDAGIDLLPESFGAQVHDGLRRHGPAWRMPIPDSLLAALVPEGSVSASRRASYLRRLTPHPAAAFVDPLALTGHVEKIARTFVRCTGTNLAESVGDDPIEAGARRARDAGWAYRELATAHDPQLFDPAGTAAVLEELAATPR